MKKIFIILLCSMCFMACSKEINEVSSDKVTPPDTEKAFTNLNSQLEVYNQTYQFDVQTRKGFWKRLLWVVTGDACGAAIGFFAGVPGAIVGGVLNSLLWAAIGLPSEFL